ncbi:MAG: translation elongation factor Ts [bacterium]
MSDIDLILIKKIREQTGAGVLESKEALAESGNDLDKAINLLRKKGLVKAAKKQDRATREGVIGNYLHPNKKVAALIEISCETDFVARTEDFQALAHDLAMQVAAANPQYLKPEDIPEEELNREKEVAQESPDVKGKPDQVMEKIIQGKLEKYYQGACLLKQKFIKDEDKIIEQLLAEAVVKFGENIQIGNFIRFQL